MTRILIPVNQQLAPKANSFQSIDHIIFRPQLNQYLQDTNESSITTLIAPSGNGKTTLLQQYYNNRKRNQPICWLTLHPADDNASRFFNRLTTTIRTAVPDFDGYTLNLSAYGNSAEGLPYVGIFKQALFDLNKHITIIIDNCESLAGADWLQALAELFNPRCRVRWIFASSDPEFLIRLRTFTDITPKVLHAKHLNFNGAESEEFLACTVPQRINESVNEFVFKHTKGHPGTLKLIQLGMVMDADNITHDCLSILEQGTALQSQLTHLIIDSLQPNIRQLMVDTAFLGRFNDELCEFVLNKPSCSQELHFLEKTNFLLQKFDNEFLYYQFHPTIRGVLLQYFNQQKTENNDRLVSRACTWLTEHNQREEVLGIAGYHSQAVFYHDQIRQHVSFWLKSGNIETLATAIQNPQNRQLIELNEVKIAWLWVLTLSGQLNQVYDALFEMDPTLCGSSASEPNNELQANILVLFVLVDLMRDTVSQDSINRLKKLYNNTTTRREVRVCIDNILAYYETNERRFSTALNYAHRAQGLAEQCDNEFGLAISVYVQARLSYFKNDLHTATQICEQYLRRSTMAHGLGGRSLVEIVKAYFQFIGSQPEQSESITRRVIGESRIGISNEIQIALFLPTIREKIRSKQFALAEDLLKHLSVTVQNSGSMNLFAHITFERFRLASIMQDNDRLEMLSRQLLPPEKLAYYLDSERSINWSIRERWVFCQIIYLANKKELAQAKTLCKQLLYDNIDHGFPVRYLSINMALGWIEFQIGNKILAFTMLNNILLQADASGIFNGLFDDLPSINEFITAAIEANAIEQPRHLRMLLEAGFGN